MFNPLQRWWTYYPNPSLLLTRHDELQETTLDHRILKRKLIWFILPCSMNVETNIRKRFLKLVKKHFPRNNFRNIFNKYTIKISYGCMRNISSIIASHNKSILCPKATEYGCNSRKKELCPLQNQCLTPKVIYEASVVNNSVDDILWRFRYNR